jgi:hypothetical protein
MAPHPHIRLRWYEHLLFRFLSRSPRIEYIVVQQVVRRGVDPLSHKSVGYVEQLEALYRSSSADEHPRP